ncbi:MAG: winged helix-turn-helix transcriptional regulator [Longimicrobiales bacterium]
MPDALRSGVDRESGGGEERTRRLPIGKVGTFWKANRTPLPRVRSESQRSPPTREEPFHRITEILRCKWTLAILDAIDRGINRPGRLERELTGLTTKVLNERIHKLERFGVLVKRRYTEIPPRVELEFTDEGIRLLELVRTIARFVEDWHPGEDAHDSEHRSNEPGTRNRSRGTSSTDRVKR